MTERSFTINVDFQPRNRDYVYSYLELPDISGWYDPRAQILPMGVAVQQIRVRVQRWQERQWSSYQYADHFRVYLEPTEYTPTRQGLFEIGGRVNILPEGTELPCIRAEIEHIVRSYA